MAPVSGRTSQIQQEVNYDDLKYGIMMGMVVLIIVFLINVGRGNLHGKFVHTCANPRHAVWTSNLPAGRDVRFEQYVPKHIRDVFQQMGARGKKFCTDCVRMAPKKREFSQHMDLEQLLIMSEAKEKVTSTLKRKKGNNSPSPSKSSPPRKVQITANTRKQLFTESSRPDATPSSSTHMDTNTDKTTEIRYLNDKLRQLEETLISVKTERDELKETIKHQYSTQEKRIAAIKTIAKIENESIYQQTLDLTENKSRTLNNLLLQNVDDILESRNPVLIAAIEGFCEKKNVTTQSSNVKSKIRKLIAAECIYSCRNLNYVSDFLRLVQSVVYSSCQSESVVDIVGHVIPGGSYATIFSMLSELAIQEDMCAPSGLVEYAFDNEQRLFKTRYSRNGNKQVLEILTNTIVVQLDPESKIQEHAQYKPSNFHPPQVQEATNICELTPKMESVYQKEVKSLIQERLLKKYATSCNNDPVETELNTLILHDQFKICPIVECSHKNPKMKKKCEKCGVWMAKEKRAQQNNSDGLDTRIEKKIRSKPELVFHNYQPIQEKLHDMSNTRVGNNVAKVHSPKITLIPPVFVNPSSLEAVKVVLRAIGKNAGIKSYNKDGKREWVIVRCDGLPYSLVKKAITEGGGEFDWVLLRTGHGHEEMNMLKGLVELYWPVLYEDFAKSQGYISDKSLQFCKGCGDHHQAYDNFLKFCDGIIDELVHHFVADDNTLQSLHFQEKPTPEDFMLWASLKMQEDQTFNFIMSNLLPHCMGLKLFRKGVRTNNADLIRTGRRLFMPIWFCRNHTKYQLITTWDEIDRLKYPSELREILEKYESISRSGIPTAHQGTDFVLEEFNKDVKKWMVGQANCKMWERVICNHDSLCQLKEKLKTDLLLPSSENRQHTYQGYENELIKFKVVLRKAGYFCPTPGRQLVSVTGQELCPGLVNLCTIGKERQREFISKYMINNIYPAHRQFCPPVYVTVQEKDFYESDQKKTKSQLLDEMQVLLSVLPQSDLKKQWQNINKPSMKKTDIIDILNNVRKLCNEVEIVDHNCVSTNA